MTGTSWCFREALAALIGLGDNAGRWALQDRAAVAAADFASQVRVAQVRRRYARRGITRRAGTRRCRRPRHFRYAPPRYAPPGVAGRAGPRRAGRAARSARPGTRRSTRRRRYAPWVAPPGRRVRVALGTRRPGTRRASQVNLYVTASLTALRKVSASLSKVCDCSDVILDHACLPCHFARGVRCRPCGVCAPRRCARPGRGVGAARPGDDVAVSAVYPRLASDPLA